MNPLKNTQDWIDRLKRIEDQVRGLQSMVESNQSCPELMMQISSVKAALHKLGVKIFETRLQEKFQLIVPLDDHSQSDDHIKEMLVILSHNFK